MSIQEEINRIEQNVANTYIALNEMGATMPAKQNIDNLVSTARTVPQGGGGSGDAAQEIFYVDGTFDMSTLTFSTNVTYNDILSMVELGKYVVAKAAAHVGNTPTNVIYLALSGISYNYAGGVASFEGMMQVNGADIGLAAGLIMLAVTVEVDHRGHVNTRIKVVSTQTLK